MRGGGDSRMTKEQREAEWQVRRKEQTSDHKTTTMVETEGSPGFP